MTNQPQDRIYANDYRIAYIDSDGCDFSYDQVQANNPEHAARVATGDERVTLAMRIDVFSMSGILLGQFPVDEVSIR